MANADGTPTATDTPTESMQDLCDAAAERAFMRTYMGSQITARGAWLYELKHGRPAAPVGPTLQEDRAELAAMLLSYLAESA